MRFRSRKAQKEIKHIEDVPFAKSTSDASRLHIAATKRIQLRARKRLAAADNNQGEGAQRLQNIAKQICQGQTGARRVQTNKQSPTLLETSTLRYILDGIRLTRDDVHTGNCAKLKHFPLVDLQLTELDLWPGRSLHVQDCKASAQSSISFSGVRQYLAEPQDNVGMSLDHPLFGPHCN